MLFRSAHRFIGAAQRVGIFAFQAALNLCSGGRPLPAAPPRLHPRPRDCVVLAGRGYSNKQIARALALTPRTVDGYLTEARRLFDAHRSEEHTSELQSLMRISHAVFCLNKTQTNTRPTISH